MTPTLLPQLSHQGLPNMETKQQELILLVDDNPTNIKVVADFLKEFGLKVIVAKSGASCLKKLEKVCPDLILLDVVMPELDGFETCRRLKAWPKTQDIPIIFMTAVSDSTVDKVKGLTIGAVDYITKPIIREEVLARVNVHLRLCSLTKQLKEQNRLLQQEVRQRILAEETLSLSEEKFSKAFRASPDPMTISTLENGRFIEVNKSFLQLTGYSKQEVVGYTVDRLKLWFDPEQHATIIQTIQKVGAVHDLEIEYSTKLGELRVGLASAEIINCAGEDCLLVVIKDITDRKQVEVALQKVNKELQRLATLDGLTQVTNRRRFDEYLDQEWHKHAQKQKPLSLILCDVDCFKAYNDTYGHQAGDDCLRVVAKAIMRRVDRQGDLVARYGGEEFAAILPEADNDWTLQVASLLREQVERLKIPHSSSIVSNYITVSLGFASIIPNLENSPETLIRMADRALYQAKKQGRNRSVAYQEIETSD